MAYKRRWTPEDRERGLTTLVLAGSSVLASEECGIPAVTLRSWKLDHREQYDRIAETQEPEVVKRIAAGAERTVLRLNDIQDRYLDEMEATIHELKPGEIPGALRNAATAAALNIDKLSSPLRERPSHVNQGISLDAIQQAMQRTLGLQPVKVPNQAIEATAQSVD
jgi:transposase-like protein